MKHRCDFLEKKTHAHTQNVVLTKEIKVWCENRKENYKT